MGDNIADLSPEEPGVPPVPLKTYQWEDVRRQKLEGRYPWTHLYKPPFDLETYEKIKDHEYEPVIPMDTNRKTPPPFVKVTPEEDNKRTLDVKELPQDKTHLCLPSEDIDDEDENDYEDDDDDTEEITAAELQNRLEEKYFRQSPGSSKHEYELTETRSVSPAMTDTSRESSSFKDKVHSKTDILKQKFKNLKDHISKDHVVSTPQIARKKDNENKSKPVKKNKFNFRRHNKSSEGSNFHMPQASRLSFTSLPSFSRSRSSSVKERERKRSQSSESDSQKRKMDFHFGTYPRFFAKTKKNQSKCEKPTTPKLKSKSAPGSPSARRSPFPQRWISKFTENKKEDRKEEKKSEPKAQKVVQESIFISLHEDISSPRDSSTPREQPIPTDEPPQQMKIDNKNFIFISLHEERFPEKLEKMQQENEEAKIETEIKKAETTRKFATLLRKLETDRKIRSRRGRDGKFTDDKPEPVVITEITNDEDDADNNSPVNLENSVETPDEPQTVYTPTEPKVFVEEAHSQYKEEIIRVSTPEYTEEIIKVTKPEYKDEIIKVTKTEYKEDPFKFPSKPTTPKPTRSEVVFESENVHLETSTPSSPQDSKETSKFAKLKELIKETERKIKPSTPPSVSKEKEKESKKFQEFKENLLKETEKIGTLKNKIKHYFAKESEKDKSDIDDKHIYEEFDNVDDSPTPPPPQKHTIKHVAINESLNQEIEETVPQKIPRKKLKKFDSDKESKESLSAFDDPTLNDIVTFDEQQPMMTKTYISESLQEVNEIPVEREFIPNPKHFRNYEKALEKTKSSSIEIENNLYSASNSLAQLETPVPPSRPSRTRSLQRPKPTKRIFEEQENTCDAESNQNYNTFPMTRPDKPRRKFRKPRTYSNFTNSEVKSVNELEDAAISQNIANSKQLSVSFLPLMSNSVGEPIIHYTLRETSSMIHLSTTVINDPPTAPKRRRSSVKDGTSKYNTLPNKKYCSKTSSKSSLAESETCHGIHAEEEDFDYVDEGTSAAETPPQRPLRKRSSGPSFIDDDRTSREIESLPSEKSFCDSDSKDINGYSVIKSVKKSHSQPTTLPESSNTTPRRKSRRLSDFFTLPRIHTPTNYVSPPSTLPYERRLPSPSRPPRKSRPHREPVYTNEENINVMTDFGDEEEFNFNLATVNDDILEFNEKDEKNLQTDEVMERMKIRPLPPPPRPTRKPRDEKSDTLSCDYSRVKKNADNKTNNLNQNINELKIININKEIEKHPAEPVTELERSSTVIKTTNRFEELARDTPSTSGTLNVITTQRLNVSELNVEKLSINEIESSKITTSNVDTTTMQATDFKSERGNLIINSVEITQPLLSERLPSIFREPRPIIDNMESRSRDVTPSSDEVPIQDIQERSRISSMIPEVGSDEESTSAGKKIVKPSRRKPVKKEDSPRHTVSETNSNQPTLAELMCQILQICHSSVGQAIHSLLEQVIPEDREKRNEVQAAIWVITIIIAGCLMLGLQSNEKIVHHHHWDFHFPPPH